MSALAGAGLGAYCALACWYDLERRQIPNWLPLIGAICGAFGGELGWWSWSYVWMVLIAVPLLIADVGKGDVKASMVLGGLFGYYSTWIDFLAFGFMIPFWISYQLGWSRYPGNWPFFPLLSGAACAIVLVGGI